MNLGFLPTLKLVFGLIVVVVWMAAVRCDPFDRC